MRRVVIFASVVFLLSACDDTGADKSVGAIADPVHVSADAALSASCSGCHSATGSAIVGLEEISETELFEKLSFYKYDADGTTVMHRLARGYSDDQLKSISSYLARAGDTP